MDMVRLLFGLGVAAVVFTIYAVVDCAFFDRTRIRGLRRGWWIVVILFVPIIGGLLWFIIGRGRAEPVGRVARRARSHPTTTPSSCAASAPTPSRTSASAASSRSSPSSTPTTPRARDRVAPPAPPRRPTARSAPTASAPTHPTPPVRPAPPGDRMAEPAPHRTAAAASPASDAAVALLCAFVREGVRDLVVAPGSRSQALALAAAELERVGAMRLHVRIDERGAAFLALGTRRRVGAPGARHHHVGHRRREPAPRGARGAPLGRAADRLLGRPPGGAARHPLEPDDHAAGHLRGRRCDSSATSRHPRAAPGEADAAAAVAREAVAAALGRDAAGDPVPHPGPGRCT